MFELYRDASNEWRWRLIASNGRVLADSGEGYIKRSQCLAAVDRVKALVPPARVIEAIM